MKNTLLLISFLCLAGPSFGQESKPEKKPQDEIHKGLRFNFENRFFLRADFPKAVKGEFIVTTKPDFEKTFKDQTVVTRYKECSSDPVVPLDPDLYQLSYYGEKAAVTRLNTAKNLKMKIRILLNKEALMAIPHWHLKSKLISIFNVRNEEDCGIAAEPLKSTFNSKKFEISADCISPSCAVASPVINKSSQGELNFMVGFIEDDFKDELEEEKATKAEEAAEKTKKTGP